LSGWPATRIDSDRKTGRTQDDAISRSHCRRIELNARNEKEESYERKSTKSAVALTAGALAISAGAAFGQAHLPLTEFSGVFQMGRDGRSRWLSGKTKGGTGSCKKPQDFGNLSASCAAFQHGCGAGIRTEPS